MVVRDEGDFPFRADARQFAGQQEIAADAEVMGPNQAVTGVLGGENIPQRRADGAGDDVR